MAFELSSTGNVVPFPGRAEPPRALLRPVLVVLHQEHSTPGRVGNALRALGHALDIRRPRFGDPLPETLDAHAGAVIFGGPMSANDSDDYLAREIDWIESAAARAAAVPRHLPRRADARQTSGRQSRAPRARPDPDRLLPDPTRPTPGRSLLPDWPSHVYHWHREGFELPAGTELLAHGDDFPNQAFRAGHAFGFQFHPDVTTAMMHCWTTRGDLDLPGAQPRHQHFEGRAIHDVAERAWLAAFIDGWLKREPLRGARRSR